jgi:lysozyme family protein
MARIREYTQQSSVGGEVGGRRATAEDFGSGFGREMQHFGETMVSVGAYIKQDQERKEVDDAQVKLAESRQQWTETYLKREQEMVPGDTTLAPTIRTEMKDYFGSMAEGYTSRAAKKYVQLHGETMATGFFTQGLQHQSQMAGRKALEDIGNRTAADSNTVYMNPQLYEMVKGTYQFDSANGVGTAHARLKNDPRKETIDREYVQNLAWQAGQGALKNPAMRGFIVGNIEGPETQTTANMFQALMPSIFKTEGGYVANDGKRGATNYGINGQANGLTPEQVKKLTPDQAQQIYKNNYWDKYQLETLPAAAIPVVFDGVINHGSEFAQSLVAAAKQGATPQQLADMRKAEYTRLITNEPDAFKKYEKSWTGRVDRAAAESAKLTTQQTAPLTVDESKLPVWYSDMSPEGKDRFLREALALTKQERAVSDQALSRTMKDHQAELAIYGGKLKSQPLSQAAFIGKPME